MVFGLLLFQSPAEAAVTLTDNANDYTIENEYYKAVIPKASASNSRGIIEYLYVKKQDTSLSQNLVHEPATTSRYGLGFLEGSGNATGNNAIGLQDEASISITILENTSSKIRIKSEATNNGTNYIETWTFWAKKPYFQSEAEATVTNASGYLTNQSQFAWMINPNLTSNWYATDKDGDAVQLSGLVGHQIHSPNLNTYPWINYQFPDETVSFGTIFTDVYDHLGTVAETGEWKYEYQLDFALGGGSFGSPIKQGYKRAVTTIYYTTNEATNTDISAFAQNHYQNATATTTENPTLQATNSSSNIYLQKTGISSALVSSPYFLLRQNTQNPHTNLTSHRQQYETSIYAPIYKNQNTIRSHNSYYDFEDQLLYSLKYSNDTQTFDYGTIASATPSNSSYETSLQNTASSSDGKVDYSTTFKTWSDSDKLQITGTASNGSASAPVKDIYVAIKPRFTGLESNVEAESATPTESIVSSLITTDNKWTNYNIYSGDSGTSLIYKDNEENVPTLTIPLSVSDGQYYLRAYVWSRIEGDITYYYSTDNSNWNNFVAPAPSSGQTELYVKDLGIVTISGGVLYINDDDSAVSGITGYPGWDRITLQAVPRITDLGSNVYDVRLSDAIYGNMGIGVKVNSPTDNITVDVGDSELRVYLYKQDTEQTLTTFSYPFDVEIYPHTGWLSSSSEFTSLHSRNALTYSKHTFYLPEGIHTGRTNTVYSEGSIAYSTEPYNNTSLVNLTLTPSTGTVDVVIDTWNTSGNYYKKWTETGSTAGITTGHTVSSLNPNAIYDIKVDGQKIAEKIAGQSGQITFDYSGGYSTKTFEVADHVWPPSSPTSCNDTVPGGSPYLYSATAKSSSAIALQWVEAGEPVDKYAVEYGTKSGVYQFGAESIGGKGTTSYLVQELSPGTKYYFRVRAGNRCATGPWSGEISAATYGRGYFGIPSLTTGTNLETEIIDIETVGRETGVYTVQAGDTLYSIAEEMLGDGSRWPELVELNQDKYPSLVTNPGYLVVGWELTLPGEEETGEEAGYDVTVKVIDEKEKPVEGARVEIHSEVKSATTDKKGIAAFTNVEGGEHQILIAYNNQQGEQNINLTGDTVEEFKFTIQISPTSPFRDIRVMTAIGGLSISLLLAIIFLIKRKR